MSPTLVYGIILMAVPVLLSLTLHEYGHARVALFYGDQTARLMGRVTMNPLAHLDPLGTIGFFFGPMGWAKPVPVNPANLRGGRWSDIAVSAAGVSLNASLALAAAMTLNLLALAGVRVDHSPTADPTMASIALCMLALLMEINLCMMAFNLLPLYPLDGHHIVRELLPAREQGRFMEFQLRYGRACLIGMVALPWLMQWLPAEKRVPFDPIGSFLGHVIFPAIDAVLSVPAQGLFYGVLHRYAHCLLW